MATDLNFKNFGTYPRSDHGEFGRPPGNFPLSLKSSINSLTFDQRMNSGGIGKEVGSMKMDELLKNVWTAEELQNAVEAVAREVGAGSGGVGSGKSSGMVLCGNLQRQAWVTLTRTLSQNTVDEVWKDVSQEYGVGENGEASGDIDSNFPTRQQNFGDVTLENFLLRAGVVKEDTQLVKKPLSGIFAEISYQGQGNSNAGLGFGFQQLCNTTGLTGTVAFPMINDKKNAELSTTLPLDVNGVRSNMQHQQLPQSQAQPPRQHKQIFSKQLAMPFATRMASPTSVKLSSPGIRNGIVGIGDQGFRAGLVQGSALQVGEMDMVGWRPAPVTVATVSPANQLSSNGTVKNNDNSSASLVPYMFNGRLRVRRGNGAVEKVVERRQRRMIKNRESAARSRARKQVMKTMKMQLGVKRCLRRTQTCPW